jgi:hypothetical protein
MMHASDGEPDLGGHLARLAAGGAGGAEHTGAGARSWRSTHTGRRTEYAYACPRTNPACLRVYLVVSTMSSLLASSDLP